MTAMKLQKLAYYCQSWSLAWDGVPLFDEEFQAWANGPVCPELFVRHKGKFMIDAATLGDVPEYIFSENEVDTLDKVLDYYGDKEPQWLSELTHKERPWKETRTGVAPGEKCFEIIDKNLMQEYYEGISNV